MTEHLYALSLFTQFTCVPILVHHHDCEWKDLAWLRSQAVLLLLVLVVIHLSVEHSIPGSKFAVVINRHPVGLSC
jgi:hypothetical protein